MSAHRIFAVILLASILIVTGVATSGTPDSFADEDTCGSQNNPFNRPEGQLIQYGGTISVTDGCNRRPFTDTTSLLSYNFDGSVKIVSTNEYNSLPSGGLLRAREGTIFRNSSTGSLYIVDQEGSGSTFRKRYISSDGWQLYFAACGSYPYTNVSSSYLNGYSTGGTVSSVTTRPDGQLIATPDGKVYFLQDGKKRWIVNPPALQSYNFPQPVCNVSYGEAAGYSNGSNMWAREGTLVASGNPVYIIRETPTHSFEKRHIVSADAFNYYGFSWGAIRQWSQGDVNQYTTGPTAHPVKSLHIDRWYKSLASSSLKWDKQYLSGISPATWDSAISSAQTAWNGSPTYVSLSSSPVDPNNDIRVKIDNYVDDLDSYGSTAFYGSVGGGWCGNPPDCPGSTYRQVEVRLNNWTTPASLRQTVVVHEFGHAVTLDHDGLNGPITEPTFDGACGTPRVPVTIMDYDCQYTFGVNTPQNWDFCGVNHAYPGYYGVQGC